MAELTERQAQLLKDIVEEYIRTGQPVGSVHLVEKRGLKVSSATVRNEMARLTKEGYLHQPHTSAGRVPTTTGLRYFLDHLLQEEELPVLKEVSIKQRLWQERSEADKLLRQAALSLAEQSNYFALVSGGPGRLFTAGAAGLLEYPEFFDIDVTKAALSLADREGDFESLIKKAVAEKEVHVLLGEELGGGKLQDCALAFANFSGRNFAGVAAVLGPIRLDFAKIVPTLRYFKNLIAEISLGM